MQRFAFRLLIFLLPVLVPLTAIEFILHSSQNSYSLKRKLMDSAAATSEVWIGGTSHTECGLNPDFIHKKSINIAEAQQTYYFDNQIIERYLEQASALRLVILPLDYFSLYLKLPTQQNRYFSYYHYWNIDHPRIGRFDLRKYSLLLLYGPTYSWKIVMEDLRKKNLHAFIGYGQLHENGYLETPDTRNYSKLEENAAYLVDFWNKNYFTDGGYEFNTHLLDELAYRLGQKNIRLLLISMPMTDQIRRHFNPATINKTHLFIDHFLTRHSNCTYADCSTEQRLNLSDFYDPNHLNKKGAEKFSKIISLKIDSLIP